MRWEYKVINFNQRSFFTGAIDAGSLEQLLNNLGRDNWELVSTSQNPMQKLIVILKRPK